MRYRDDAHVGRVIRPLRPDRWPIEVPDDLVAEGTPWPATLLLGCVVGVAVVWLTAWIVGL